MAVNHGCWPVVNCAVVPRQASIYNHMRSHMTDHMRSRDITRSHMTGHMTDHMSTHNHMQSHLSWAMGMLSPENMLFLGSLTLSLNFLSSFSATISAALPLGQRMMGMVPEEIKEENKSTMEL